MAIWAKIRGTIETIFQIGLAGPQLKNNAGAVEHRNAADSTFVVARALDPSAANDLVTLGYLQAHTAVASNWIAVAAGATQAVVAGGMYEADSTGALVTFNVVSAPADGSVFFVKLLGSTVAVPAAINAGAGDTIEDPQTPGTFSSVAGRVAMLTPGQKAGFKYQTANTRWIQFL